MCAILIKNGRIISPVDNIDRVADLLVINGKIHNIGCIALNNYTHIIDATGLFVFPGLIDMHTHLRQPGYEHKDTLESLCISAKAGGFSTIAVMPNTNPPLDTPDLIRYVISEASKFGLQVLPVAAITKGLKGKEITDFDTLSTAGAVAFSDDGMPVSNSRIMMEALFYSKNLDKPIIAHCEDLDISASGIINDGEVAKKKMLKGIPKISEEIMVLRDIALARHTKGRLHITHLSTKNSVEYIRTAKREGINISCDVTPHHLTLTEEYLIKDDDPNLKMKPPLRTQEDVDALIEGLNDGTIDAIASDHAPHSIHEKSLPITEAPFGVIGLETTLSVILTNLVFRNKLDISKAIAAMTINPARILKINKGTLMRGQPADIVIVNPNLEWVIKPESIKSKAKNTPFANMKVKGKIVHLIIEGKLCF